LSVLILAAAGIAWTLSAAVAPWRYELQQMRSEWELARSLVVTWGSDTLSPFALRADKSYFFAEREQAFLAYRVVGGVAIVSGDPIGEPEALVPLLARFLAFAHARGWRVAVLGASEAALPLYRGLGLRAVYHGDEAVLDVGTFSLEGRAIRKVRQSVQRLEREGYTVRILRPAEVPPPLRAELEQIASGWRGGEPQKGFVMALDTLFGRDDDGDVFVIGCGPDGRPAGFIHFATSPACGALSLSSMPRLRTTPNGFNEWLICETVAWSREHRYERISLNFAPFAALFAADAELEPLQRVERRALRSLKGQFQLDNLLHFNEKFGPGWSRRYVVVERRRDLPRVSVAALAAESYLPFAARSSG
jgi:lysyl-tRNA synthetase class 2